MVQHQLLHQGTGVIVKFQTPQNLFRQVGTDNGMAVKMRDSLMVPLQSIRLAQIMEQHCQTQNSVCPDSLHGMQNMLSHREAVMRMLLLRLHGPVKFRKEHPGHSQCICLPEEIRMRGAYQLYQLRLDPFRADTAQVF